ncbi:cell division protein ZapE [Alteriqipengyuania lutimaris]|uniref:AFG1 family ATPase n=1 Tax=Alteriqipengyuania lutimaris TaxID=1538146 RepID=A0A395LRJ3_9SPHN|nr:cell division protein ZapE [Alteriqipengyuania lutimaris]MBB3032763.1 cell division protein ZapE [Alteriqipengyuania lutimaris]RDS78134.1 AFG1 family ATPase [Alteriqipengyuania lutimaris]
MTSVLTRYEELLATKELKPDEDQRAAVAELERVQRELEAGSARKGLLGGLLGKKPQPVRGLYMWGGVGRGKSMLMDLFFECLDIGKKRRVHFHAFMLEVDAMIAEERAAKEEGPVRRVAARIAEDVRCLAFDEMVVNNTADAAIMARLFTPLIEDHGVTIVTTSNRPPHDLYKDGLNRSLFLPFIDLIERELDTLSLNGPTDYRLDRLGGLETWHTPLGDRSTAQVREAFFRLTDYEPEDAAHVPSSELDLGGGRTLHVPKSLKGVGVFSFKRLCGENRGASDYLAVARAFHTVIVVGVPLLSPENRNEAIRFTKLIDALYEHKVKLFATAAAEPEALYPTGDGSFEFDRTVSRLREMQSDEYMARGHGPE